MIALRVGAVVMLLGSTGAMAGPVTTFLPNTVSVEPGPQGQALPEPVFVAAIDDALAARGFTTLQEPGHARLIAALAVTRVEVGTTPSTVPVAGPTAMAGGAVGVGASLSINLPTGKRQMVPLVRTRIDVQLITRSDSKTLWHGSAVTVRAATDDPRQVASALANGALNADGEATDGAVAVP